MARPADYQWRPLDLDSDPIPGDPAAVGEEAARLTAAARTIGGQITALRKIASDTTEAGEHADKIRSTAGGLADSLTILAARYTRVSAALDGWAGDLQHAQAVSLQALTDAEPPYAYLRQLAAAPSGGEHAAAAAGQLVTADPAAERARAQLAEARTMLSRAVLIRDNQGALYAGQIRQASDDQLTDHASFWSHYAWIVKDVCTGLEVAATVAAVAAFVLVQFVPVADVIVDSIVAGAFIAGAGATVGRFIMAETGNGSWTDFALDAFACLTFGTSRVLGITARALASQGELASSAAMVTELVEGSDAKAAELARFAQMMGSDVSTLAEQYGPKLARMTISRYELSGVWNVSAHLGSLSAETEHFARSLAVAERFTGQIGNLGALAKVSLAASGFGAALTTITASGALLCGGVEIDGPSGPTPLTLHIPGLSRWYVSRFEKPTGG